MELPLKKDGFTSESTTLEALLRGEGVEKKVDAREEESIQEIQVFCACRGGCHRIWSWCLQDSCTAWALLRARAGSQTAP